MTVPIILGCLDVPLFVEHDHSKQEELWVEWKSTDESCNRLPVHSEERALVKDAPLQLYAKHVLENTMADKKKNSDNYGATASGKQQGKGPRATQNYPHLKYKVYRPPHFSAGVHQALYTHAPNRGCFVAIKKKIE